MSKDADAVALQSVGVIGPAYPNHLRAWREKRELTQEQLAERVGCSAASIGHWENGERRLTDKWLPKLAEALDTTAGRILETSPEDVGEDILEVWQGIPKEKRAQALAVLRTFRTGTDG